jgi:hypothetical protein
MTRQWLRARQWLLLSLGLSSLTTHASAAGISLDLGSTGQYVVRWDARGLPPFTAKG